VSQAYPLAWPGGIPRAKKRSQSRFEWHTVAQCVAELRRQIGILNGAYLVISSNIPLKTDGNPYSDPGRLPDPGAVAWFQLHGKAYCFPCDQWSTVEENFWAIAKHIEAMRGMLRWGVGSIEQQFAGFKALAPGESCWDVLGLHPNANQAEVLKSYRAMARDAHPDTPGGSTEAMQRLNQARDEAIAALKGVTA
jgi:hypothetical protein